MIKELSFTISDSSGMYESFEINGIFLCEDGLNEEFEWDNNFPKSFTLIYSDQFFDGANKFTIESNKQGSPWITLISKSTGKAYSFGCWTNQILRRLLNIPEIPSLKEKVIEMPETWTSNIWVSLCDYEY